MYSIYICTCMCAENHTLFVCHSLDYVCVLDLDWLELTLRLCNTAQFDENSQKVHGYTHT